MAVLRPKRGEVWWIQFDPSVGSEVRKKRPAVIVSNNIANRHLDRVQVIPLTSNTKNVYPSECVVTVKGQECKAMADQIKTVSLMRCQKKISKLTKTEVLDVEKVIRVQLALD